MTFQKGVYYQRAKTKPKHTEKLFLCMYADHAGAVMSPIREDGVPSADTFWVPQSAINYKLSKTNRQQVVIDHHETEIRNLEKQAVQLSTELNMIDELIMHKRSYLNQLKTEARTEP